MILPEPQPLLTETPKVPGLDGQKMSKSYGNAILLREEPASVTKKIRTMPTDPARVRRTDTGDPNSVRSGRCIRCIPTPLPAVGDARAADRRNRLPRMQAAVIDAIIKEQEPMRERAQRYLDDPSLVRNIVADGCERARKLAEETMRDVREAMGLALVVRILLLRGRADYARRECGAPHTLALCRARGPFLGTLPAARKGLG